MNKLKCLLISANLIAIMTSFSVAGAAAPIATCEQYLNYSDARFSMLLSVSPGAAKTAATELGACLQANACSNINNIDACAATLATRTFLSNFYANAGHNNGMGASAPPATGSRYPSTPLTETVIRNNNSAFHGHRYQQPPVTDSHKKTQSNSTSIHWF